MGRAEVSGVTEKRTLGIVIVSEVRFCREILAEFLERDPSVSVVGLCADLAEVVASSPPLQADVVLVDGALRDGVAAARRARRIKPDIRLIVYAVSQTKDDVIVWSEAGVIGYVPDTAASADLVRLIMGIHAGQQPCSARSADVNKLSEVNAIGGPLEKVAGRQPQPMPAIDGTPCRAGSRRRPDLNGRAARVGARLTGVSIIGGDWTSRRSRALAGTAEDFGMKNDLNGFGNAILNADIKGIPF